MNAWISGLRASLAIMLGYTPIAIAFGLAANEIGLSIQTTLLVSGVVFAGASQFVMVSLWATGTPPLIIVLTTLLLNLRHVLYGPLIAPHLQHSPGWQHLLAAFGLTDEVFAAATGRMDEVPESDRMAWLLGLEAGAYGAWLSGTWLGATGGAALTTLLPAIAPALAFALPTLFLVLLLPVLQGRVLIAALVAAGVAGIAQFLGMATVGLLAAAVLGPLVALVGSRWRCQQTN